MRAILYARCSTRGEGQDPEVQLAQLRGWAEQRGWTVVAEEQDRVSGDPHGATAIRRVYAARSRLSNIDVRTCSPCSRRTGS